MNALCLSILALTNKNRLDDACACVFVCSFNYFLGVFFISEVLDVLFGVDIQRERYYCVLSCVCEFACVYVSSRAHMYTHTQALVNTNNIAHVHCTHVKYEMSMYFLKFAHLSAVCVVIMQIIRNSHIYLFDFFLSSLCCAARK